MPSTCLQPCFRSIRTGRQPAFLHHVPFAPGRCFFMSHASPAEGSVPTSDFPPTLAHLMPRTAGQVHVMLLGTWPFSQGSWAVCSGGFAECRGRSATYFCADCRSPVSICKMQRRAQRDSYGTFDFDTFVALFNSGTLRHPVTAQFACHKRA